MLSDATNRTDAKANELLGEFQALMTQLGCGDGEEARGVLALNFPQPLAREALSLDQFLLGYLAHVLIPVELPAIYQAYNHTLRQEARELAALDQSLAREERLISFARPSQRAGQNQLQRLQALRDQRTVQRYLKMVQAGQAFGWHTLVYGVTLAVYSMPLRQGLLHYAQQALHTFATRARVSYGASPEQVRPLLETCFAQVLPAIEKTLLTPAPTPGAIDFRVQR